MSSQTLKDGNFSFEWRKARSFKEDDGEVLIVPVKMKQNVAVWRFSLINNKGKKEQTPMYSVLYVKKLNRSGATVSRILSYAPARNHLRKFRAKTEIEWYDPTHTDYSGLLLVSSLNGILSHAINFEKGHREYVIRPKRHHHDHAHTIGTRAMVADSTLSLPNRVSPSSTVFFNMRTVTSDSAIRSYSYDDETYEQPGCIFCGGNPYTCECFVVEVCKTCGYDPEDCTCKCIICDEDPCVCEYCDTCHSLIEDCMCPDPDETLPGEGGTSDGSGGSGGNGGNGTGTGAGTGGSSIGGGSTNTSLPTITGGTVEQRNTIQNIVNDLISTYKLDMTGIKIELMEMSNCTSSAKLLPEYSGIGICPRFFQYNIYDQTAKLWHEVFHIKHDDRNCKGPSTSENFTLVEPPADIKEDIIYLIETDYGFTQSDPEWYSIYQNYVCFGDRIDPIFNQNEISAYKAEIEEFPYISAHYSHERNYQLWLYETSNRLFYSN